MAKVRIPNSVLSKPERHQLQVIALLVQKLGGRAVITDKEMQDAQDKKPKLERHYDPFYGWVYEVKESK